MAEDESPNEDYCTRAITGGDNATHQAIYICDTCQLLPQSKAPPAGDGKDMKEPTTQPPLPSCICQSCAEICHVDHDVYFVGMGPCTCDCPNLVIVEQTKGQEEHCCVLQHRSIEEARKLGFDITNNKDETLKQLNIPLPMKVPPNCTLLLSAASILSENGDDGMSDDGDNSNILCIECNTTMGGHSFGAFAIPTLTNNETMCQSLIRQAEVLVGESKETFWMPCIEDEQQQKGWCDLEILARDIYKYHVESYRLDNGNIATSCGGAEWWVQYKPVGSQKAPVDLHYDKDEVLAEKFGLGSFPTLSTVTYLTGRDDTNVSNCNKISDNEPTVIFSHTYDDDEDRPIEMMLLSHAVRGKHIVFDGRLLHGAPSNAAWQPNSKQPSSSSLRVTFLVNIWLTGKPAGVDILPEAIRSKVIAANDGEESKVTDAMISEYRERHVTRYTVPRSNHKKIFLPFVSSGATWIEERTHGSNEETDSDDEGEDDNDGGEEQEEEELVLALPQFATPEYIRDQPDTALFTFEVGAARLVRGDQAADDEAETEDCRWRLLISSNKEQADSDDDDDED
jgi:hypothetical protein